MRVSGLLLGSVASLAMMSVAGAADLPMKAKAPAVQYVKICSLYGAGFYYIPGTDTCLKIGGYIRTQVEWNAGNGGVVTGSGAGMNGQGRFTRTDTNDTNYRVRAVVTFDARTQGEYGTLRSYYRVGWASQTPGGSAAGTTAQQAYWDRAFIQFAGFTVGKAQSFFDIYSYGGSRSYLNVRTSGDNGAAGLMLWAYTAQFGNGFSATLSLEDPRGHNLNGVLDISSTAFFQNPAAPFVTDNGLNNNAGGAGFQVPDIVANLRIDQPWGFFGVSAALTQVAGGYYQANPAVPGCIANTTTCGHPGDKWGYAIGVGGQLNVPGMPGDTLGAMFRWSQGANGYSIGAGANSWLMVSGNTAGGAWGYDAIFANPGVANGGVLHLTEAWSVNAHYEHLWSRALKTSVYGGYAEVKYPGGAKALICGAFCGPLNPDFSFYQIGSRTQWSPWAGQLNIGVDVVYTNLQTAAPGPNVFLIPGGAQTAKRTADQDIFSVMFRVQRNWYP
jgi:hypothetical protein